LRELRAVRALEHAPNRSTPAAGKVRESAADARAYHQAWR
jgi:hypothetical protein